MSDRLEGLAGNGSEPLTCGSVGSQDPFRARTRIRQPAGGGAAPVLPGEQRREQQLGDLRWRRAHRRRAALAALAPAALLAAGASSVTWAGSSWWLGVLVGVVVAGSVLVAIWRAVPPTVRLLGASRVGADRQPRVYNLVEGLCAACGLRMPQIWVLHSEVANALAASSGPRRSCLVVTSALVGRLSLVELEGVLAHLIGRLRSGELVPATVEAVGGWALVRGLLRGSGRAADDLANADRAAVSLTRYPPGLAAALEGLTDELPVGALVGRLSEQLWLVSPSAPGAPRAAALREL